MNPARCYLLLALLLVVLMPSGESLWIDEGGTYSHVIQPDLASWWQELLATPHSERMMPLSMFFAWLSAQIFGTTEWALRAPNILWAALSVLAAAACGRLWKLPWLPLFFAIQPFLWYYANEARPYALQIACGAWIACGALHMVARRQVGGWPAWTAVLAAAALLASSLFGVVTVGVAFLVVAFRSQRHAYTVQRAVWWQIAALILWGAAFGLYYLAALRAGAAGAKIWDAGLANLVFTGYEFIGFQGLGLPRAAMREIAKSGGTGALVQAMSGRLIAMAVLFGAVALALHGLWRACRERRWTDEIVVLLMNLIAVASATFLLAMAVHFPFWGRHLAPVFPCYAFLLALGLARSLPSAGAPYWRLLPAAALGALLLASSALQRWHPGWGKDNYLLASEAARQKLTAGGRVWWAADLNVAGYYGVPVKRTSPDSASAVVVSGTTAEVLSELPPPALVILSKEDIYDHTGALRRYLAEHQYQQIDRPIAFTIWAPAAE